MKIIVLAGGLSTERDVSLTSGAGICRTLREHGHQAYLLDVFMGLPYDADKLEEVFTLADAGLGIADNIKSTEPDLAAVRASRPDQSDCMLGPNVIELCKMADIVFMGLHGDIGENGKLQAAFDVLGIKYTGPNSLGSALAMDKGITKQIFQKNGVPTPGGTWAFKNETDTSLGALGLSLPVVVKPCSGGSSIGVYIVHTEEEYEKAVQESFRYEDEIIIEPYIKGREFACGIIDGEALPVIEIAPLQGFYDYKNKYQAGSAIETCPAEISEEKTKEMQAYAEEAFRVLRLKNYARMDFMMSNTGEIYCLEANTLPGMTPTSLLPQEAEAIGISFEELCEKIIEAAVK